MIKYIKKTEEFVKITGFKNIKIENINEFVRKIRQEIPRKTWIQFFDASVIATWQHPFFALLNAQLAFRNHKNISKSIEMETLLFTSAQHQMAMILGQLLFALARNIVNWGFPGKISSLDAVYHTVPHAMVSFLKRRTSWL